MIKSKTPAAANGLQCACICLNEGIQKSVCECVCVCLPACLGVGGLERPERTREHNVWEDNRGKNVKNKTKHFSIYSIPNIRPLHIILSENCRDHKDCYIPFYLGSHIVFFVSYGHSINRAVRFRMPGQKELAFYP